MLAEVWSYLTGDAAPPDVDVEPAVPWRSTLPVSCLAVSAVAAQLLAAQRLGAPTARGLVLDGRLTRLAEAGAKSARATRATGWLAGRMWVGRGGTKGVAKNGSSMYSRGEGALQRAWRGPAKKGKFGYSSNLTKSVKGRHDYVNFHINHGRWL